MNIEIKQWPWSQVCMECIHGEHLQGETLGKDVYWCKANYPYDPKDECQCQNERMNFGEEMKANNLRELIRKEARDMFGDNTIITNPSAQGEWIVCPIRKTLDLDSPELGLLRISRINWTHEIIKAV